MQHKKYLDLFAALAANNPDLRNGELQTDDTEYYETGKRCSFFRMNNELERITGSQTQVNYPCLTLGKASGQLSGDEAQVNDLITAVFDIRQHQDNANDFDQLDQSYDDCKRIGFEIIAMLKALQDEWGWCAGIGEFEINSVRYEFFGPFGNGESGCRFTFQFKTEAFNQYDYDAEEIDY